MTKDDLAKALAAMGVASKGKNEFVMPAGANATFYFGTGGDPVTVSRIRQLTLNKDLVLLEGVDERAWFHLESLIGFKVAGGEGDTKRTGFR